ncbi:MAG: Dickkopf N-terminal cysteine-rich domain-containing protein [Kofleriaceae bacterium]
MNKLLRSISLLVTAGALTSLAGCELYFGDHGNNNNNDTWNYCGSDGLYQCQGDSCEWVSSTCPSGMGSGSSTGSGNGSGYECTSNTDCAAGCYCADGTCNEGGFCSTDADCGSGYHCDTQRSSCEPNTPPANTCDYDNQCATGQYCAPDHTCQATCTCTNDTEAQQQGYGWCDETRGTCLPGQDPNGSCGSAITCTTAMPTCPSGQIALSIDGCWTGQCRAIDSCDVPATCQRINDENDCLNRTADCSPTYTGLNCTKSDGTACTSGDSGCTCQSFVFATCTSRTPN